MSARQFYKNKWRGAGLVRTPKRDHIIGLSSNQIALIHIKRTGLPGLDYYDWQQGIRYVGQPDGTLRKLILGDPPSIPLPEPEIPVVPEETLIDGFFDFRLKALAFEGTGDLTLIQTPYGITPSGAQASWHQGIMISTSWERRESLKYEVVFYIESPMIQYIMIGFANSTLDVNNLPNMGYYSADLMLFLSNGIADTLYGSNHDGHGWSKRFDRVQFSPNKFYKVTFGDSINSTAGVNGFLIIDEVADFNWDVSTNRLAAVPVVGNTSDSEILSPFITMYDQQGPKSVHISGFKIS